MQELPFCQAANPLYGKYDPFKNITENVNLPVPLLTRFDLVYVVRDTPEKEKDSRVASHILEIHQRFRACCTACYLY